MWPHWTCSNRDSAPLVLKRARELCTPVPYKNIPLDNVLSFPHLREQGILYSLSGVFLKSNKTVGGHSGVLLTRRRIQPAVTLFKRDVRGTHCMSYHVIFDFPNRRDFWSLNLDELCCSEKRSLDTFCDTYCMVTLHRLISDFYSLHQCKNYNIVK